MSGPRKFQILDDDLIEHIAGLDFKEQGEWLILVLHPEFEGRWAVESLRPYYYFDFEEIIGHHRSVSPASLDRFLDHASELDYRVAFADDPLTILSAWDHLNDPPDFSLNSSMENTVAGMLPFQLQGFNYLRREGIKGGLAIWSTGVGKTALEAALIKQHVEHEDFDLALVVCKRNNKRDTQRKLLELGSIDYSYIFDGTPKQRTEMYGLFNDLLDSGEKLVGICNYEKIREDNDQFIDLVTGRNVVVFWDEMPAKLSNRRTLLYESVHDMLYDIATKQVKWDERRPNKLRQYDLTATPIENSPLGVLNQVRLIDPDVWPTISGWDRKFVAARDYFSREPSEFKNEERIGLEIEFMTHQVDKDDPDIANYFPSVREETILVDWSPQDRRIYDALQTIAEDLAREAKKDPTVKRLNPLQLIGVLQMLCCAPSMVQKSGENREEFEQMLAEIEDDEEREIAAQFVSGSAAAQMLLEQLKKPLTDEHCNKLDELTSLITGRFSGKKVVVFSALADYIQPILANAFDKAGITYTIYRGTENQRQEAKDNFRSDPEIQVLISSDAGSDSVDLPEAEAVIEYDQAWKHSTKTQRRNRAHRINSTHETVWFIDLLYPDSVEDRKLEIIARKRGFHDSIFRGQIAEEAISARMTGDDLWYILTGKRDD